MIDLSLRSGKYTKKRLDTKLGVFFETQRDIDLFIEALIKTGQITKTKRTYNLAETEREVYTTPRYYDLSSYIYGGRGRVGVRGGKDWIDTRGYPTSMVISKAYLDGKWVDITEKTGLKLVKGRSPETREAWRAEIPAEIKDKYNIMPTTPIRVRVDAITYRYLTSLKLWGYQYRVMLSYGETKKKQNIRFLEIDGRSFTNTVKREISNTILRDQEKIKNTILKLLSDADSEYYGLYEETDVAGNVGENIEAIPVLKKNPLVAIVELRDLQNKRVIIDWDTVTEKTRIPKTSDFRTSLHIDQGVASARGQTRLDKRWTNKGGFR